MNSAIVKVTTSRPTTTSKDLESFDMIVGILKDRLAKTSKRVYEQTISKWTAYCERQNIYPLDLRQTYVVDFLRNDDVVYSTRKRQLSALRHLASIHATVNYNSPAARALSDLLNKIKAPKENAPDRERRRRALNTNDVNKALVVWDEKNFSKQQTLFAARNRALVAMLFSTGLRRSEIVELWRSDIDFESCTLKVWHGKGDKERDVTIVNGFWIEPLKTWMDIIGPDRKYVFPPLFKGRLGKDVPMHNQAVYRAVKYTEKVSGVKMAPHDARRTHATKLLDGGADLRDVQAQLGHKNPQTTLIYDSPASALRRRKTFKLGFGEKLIGG